MALQVLFFAVAREVTGKAKETRALPSPARVGAAMEALCVDYPQLLPLRKHLRVALNARFVDEEALLQEGDELALIPPVAGGKPRCRMSDSPLEPSPFFSEMSDAGCGATLCFVGSVRERSQGRKVLSLHCEAFAPMAEERMEAIADEIQRRWPGTHMRMVHRMGLLLPQEAIVVMSVASAHRQAAFEACAFAIEELKRVVPIWKKEVYEDGEAWVGMEPQRS
ncbi:MAG: molybdopterin converting factor subunit 1 [Cystobacterineae bacterium]|nr:molybdopterin converting factor subunit 1 [Cystobacterineae bacterium]